jgi:hypothetical protein
MNFKPLTNPPYYFYKNVLILHKSGIPVDVVREIIAYLYPLETIWDFTIFFRIDPYVRPRSFSRVNRQLINTIKLYFSDSTIVDHTVNITCTTREMTEDSSFC